MQIVVVPVTTRKIFHDFLQTPFNLHQHDKNWVPPFIADVKKNLDPHGPFSKHAIMQSWVAYKNSKPIGRITGILNNTHNRLHNENIAFWGFFEADDCSKTTNALFTAVEQWAIEQGATALRGPMNPSTNHECGMQISAFETKPFVLMTQNPEYYPKLVANQGYTKVKDLQAWLVHAEKTHIKPEFTQKLTELQQTKSITIRPLSMKDFANDVDTIFKIYNDAWEKNWGFVPFSKDEYHALAKDLRNFLIPEMVYILEISGEPAAFSVWLPDMNQAFIHVRNGKLFPFGFLKLLWHLKIKKSITQGRLIVLGTIKKYQHLPLGAMLYAKYIQEAPKLGYQIAECSWILEDNLPMQSALRLIGADHYKTYRIYEKSLTKASSTDKLSKKFNNLIEVLNEAAAKSANKTAFKFLTEEGYQEITYLELQQKAQALAASLQRYPCQTERAALLLPPGLDYIIAFFACLYANMIAVPAYPPRRNHHGQRLSAIINNAEAKFILTHQAFAEHCPNVPFLITVDKMNETSSAQNLKSNSIHIDDVAFLQYTSGSTSLPKGVMITHKNLLANFDILHHHFGKNSELVCSWLPPYHDMGLIGGILYPIFIQKTAILMAPNYFLQSPMRWLDIISTEKVTTSVAPNFAYDLCVKKVTSEHLEKLDLKSWRYALNGAEPIRFETLQRFTQTFAPVGFSADAFVPVYGLAESTLIVTAAEKRKWSYPLVVSKSALEQNQAMPIIHRSNAASISFISCGQNSDNHSIRIVDPNTRQSLPENHIGEIWVSGPCIASGYWNNPELSTEILGAKLAEETDQRFLRTGDLGFLYENELFITGRTKDLIIIHGSNHYPHDIEHTVMQSHAAFMHYGTAVFSTDINGEEELIIMQEIARTHLNKLDVDSALNAIRTAVLSNHGLQIHSILLIKPHTLPKTSSGKIQRWVCRQQFHSNSMPAIFHWVREDKTTANLNVKPEPANQDQIRHWILDWLTRHCTFKLDEIKLHYSLAELGFDSIIAIELAADLQNWLGKKVDPADIVEQPSLADLIQFLQTRYSILKEEVYS